MLTECVVMPKYPKQIHYYDQTIPRTAFISLKPEFAEERKAMRQLQARSELNEYVRLEDQANYRLTATEEGFVGPITGDDFADHYAEEYNFIITCDESPQLLVDKVLNHSFLANGKKVLAAGSLHFCHGTLVGISNNSGHYRPTDDEMLAVIKALYEASNGSLKYYRSYVTDPVKEYVVLELLTATCFSDVKPLNKNEILSSNGKRQFISGYELDAEKKNEPARRFGRKLPLDLHEKYQFILMQPFFLAKQTKENQSDTHVTEVAVPKQ